MKKTVVLFLLLIPYFFSGTAEGAVGCTLRDPDRDVMRIFPKATGYRTEFLSIKENGGDTVFKKVQARLGDTLDIQYESSDVPYAYYTILKGKKITGYIHGVNQKGMYGGLQLILATTSTGEVLNFYFQRISSPEARAFKNKKFTGQFTGITLTDFYSDVRTDTGSRLNTIKDPSKNQYKDFINTLRGIKKNLILLDIFKLGEKTGKEIDLFLKDKYNRGVDNNEN